MQICRVAACWIIVAALPLAAQQTPGSLAVGGMGRSPALRHLTLANALEQARAHSPTYLQAQANADPAAEAVKAANWARLPTVSARGGVSYTGAGSSTFGGTTFNQNSPTVSSSYSIGATWQLDTRTFLTPSIQKAQQRATDESIAASLVTLTADVTSQYLTTLRAIAAVNIAAEQVARDSAFLRLAQGQQQVGQKSMIDVLTAQTAFANARVQLLQAQTTATQAKIELLRRIGLPPDPGIDSLTLAQAYPLVEPHFDLQTLLGTAHESNPQLRSLTAQERADQISLKAARLDRLPTLQISTGISGFTQQFTNESILINNRLRSAQASEANCAFQNEIIGGLTHPIPGGVIEDCKAYAGLDPTGNALAPDVLADIHTENSVFPFSFTRQPLSVSLGISLPIWDGYTRSLSISRAEAAHDQAREGVRAQRLATDAQIQSQLAAVQTAWQTIQIQDSNRVAARNQLTLANDRFRIGSGTALEVADAQNTVTQAEGAYVAAVYDYHLAVVGLEAAVGRPLR